MSESKSPTPRKNGQGVTDSSDSVIVVATGPEDTTIRPARPNLPRYYPGREPPPGYTGVKPPDTPPPPAPDKS